MITGKPNMKQTDIITAITNHTEKTGYPPSMREIGRAVGLKSTSNVHRYLNELKDKGLVEWEPLSPRTLRIKSEVQR